MRSRQRERRVVVIEGAVGPHRCVMADIARLREPGSRMVRISGAVVIIQVTSYARSIS